MMKRNRLWKTQMVETYCHTSLHIYDITGKLIKTLIDAPIEPGYHTINWNGTDDNGSSVSSGVYFYKLHAGDYSETRKCLLLK